MWRCRLEEVAKRPQKSMAQIAVAWLMAKDGVTAPIVGTMIYLARWISS